MPRTIEVTQARPASPSTPCCLIVSSNTLLALSTDGSAVFRHCDDRHRNSLLTGNGGFEICTLLRGEIGHRFRYRNRAGFIMKIVSAGETVG
jgi:hypothetical protein